MAPIQHLITCGLGALVAATTLGCSLDAFEPVVAGERDSGAGMDAAVGDAGSARDAGADAGRADAGAPLADAGPPTDAGPSDAGPLDAGQDAGEPDAGPSVCDITYGGLPGYVLCAETMAECEFFFSGGAFEDCREACEDAGGRCEQAFETVSGGTTCARGPSRACGHNLSEGICLCRR